MFYLVPIPTNWTHNTHKSRSVTFKQDVCHGMEQTPEILQGLKTGRFEAVTDPVVWSQQSITVAWQQRNGSVKFSFEAFSHSLALQSSLRLPQELHPSKGMTPIHVHLKLCQHTVLSKTHVRADKTPASKQKSCWKCASHIKTQTLRSWPFEN